MSGVDNKKCPLVLIEWEDSARPVPGWIFLRDFSDFSVVKCVSVGWLIQDDQSVKTLAPNMGEIESAEQVQASGIIRIPAKAVTRIVRLREGRAISSVCPSSRPDRGRNRKLS